jgi:hypothetical protein
MKDSLRLLFLQHPPQRGSAGRLIFYIILSGGWTELIIAHGLRGPWLLLLMLALSAVFWEGWKILRERVRTRRAKALVLRCSFCGKLQDSVKKLIAGPSGVFICNECIDICNEVIAGERGAPQL